MNDMDRGVRNCVMSIKSTVNLSTVSDSAMCTISEFRTTSM